MSNVAAGKDTDDEGESLNDVETTLSSMGIALRKSQKEWRSFEDVLDEVANKWDNFADTEKSKIATAIAGVRQQENFRALMNNWDDVKKLTDVAANSMGSASEKMEIYLDSVEAKTNEVKAAWEKFIIELNQSDSYKDALDLVIFLIHNLPTVATMIISVLAAWKSWSTVSNIFTKITNASDLFTISLQTQTMAQELATIAENTNTTAIESNTVATKNKQIAGQLSLFTEEAETTVKNTNTKAVNKNTIALETNTKAKNGVRAAGTMLSSVLGGLSLAFAAVTTAIALGSMAQMAYEKHMDNLKQSVQDAANTIGAIGDDIDNLDTIMSNLSSNYDQYNSKLIDSETYNFNLKSIEEQLISTYGEKAESINLVNKSYEQQLSLLGELKKQELLKQKAEIQKVKSDKEELLNRDVNTVMGSEDNYYGASKELQNKIWNIVNKNGMTLTERTFADQISIEGKAKNQVKVYKELQKLQEELLAAGKNDDAQRVANMLEAKDFNTLPRRNPWSKESFNEK